MTDKTKTQGNILKASLLAVAASLSLGAVNLAQAQQPGGPPDRPGAEHRDDHGGPGAKGGHYEFRDADREQLRKHYAGDVKRGAPEHRPDFRAGEPVPQAYRGKIKPIPASARHGMPPPPKGYQMGYYNGYAVVYDPVSFAVLQVMDILR